MIKNILNAADVISNLENLNKTRIAWEQGVYAQSNAQLYNILVECLEMYVLVRDDVKLRRKVTKILKSKNQIVTASTSFSVRIIRSVFDDCGTRAYSYAAVIEAAYNANIDSLKLSTWIIEKGGVENVRRSKGKSNVPTKSVFENLAIDEFESATALSSISKNVPALQPNSAAEHSYSAALVRQNSSGDFEIVFATNKITTVNHVLVDAGKQLHNKNNAANVANSNTKQASNVNAAINNAVSKSA